jgi:hypothetical protein
MLFHLKLWNFFVFSKNDIHEIMKTGEKVIGIVTITMLALNFL